MSSKLLSAEGRF